MAIPIDYAQLAAAYAHNRAVHPAVLSRLHSFIVDHHAQRVLEVGCGTGNYIGALQQMTQTATRGIDPSPAMLDIARRRWPEVTFTIGRGEQIGSDQGSVDFVFSVDAIHHVTDVPNFFRAAYRVLEAGGSICTVTDSEEIIATRAPLSIYWPESVAPELARYHAIPLLRAWMEAAGFVDLRQETVEHAFDLHDSRPYRERVFSALWLIADEAFQRGLQRLEADLARGPVRCVARYVLLWGARET